jgi:hypothetical protein
MKLTIQRMLDFEAQASKQPKRTNRVMILWLFAAFGTDGEVKNTLNSCLASR